MVTAAASGGLELDVAMARVHRKLFGRSPPRWSGRLRYRIAEKIGEGAMGAVFRAHDPLLSRAVAVKVLTSIDCDALGEGAMRSLHSEARALAGINHPHVLPCFDVGLLQAGDGRTRPYVVTELVHGHDLSQWLQEQPRALGDILAVFVAAGGGLAAVHDAGLVHRDFKPANVLLGSDGRVLVSDFGLAQPYDDRVASTGTGEHEIKSSAGTSRRVEGTLAYMAPEQQRGMECGPASDQFAFCVALFEALTGARPYRGTTSDELLREKVQGPPRWSGRVVPVALRRAIARGLDPDPARRHASMHVLVRALLHRGVPRLGSLGAIVLASAAAVAIAAGSDGAPASGAPATDQSDTAINGEEMAGGDAELRQARELRQLGHLEQAHALAEDARRLAHETGNAHGFVESTALMMWIDETSGRFEPALGRAESAYLLARAQGFDDAGYQIATSAVRCAFNLGRIEEARTWARHASSVATRLDSVDAIADSARAAAQVELASGRAHEASALLQATLESADEQEFLADDVWIRLVGTLAQTLMAAGEPARARALYEDALEIAQVHSDAATLVILRIGYAVAVKDCGDVMQAASIDRANLASSEIDLGADHRLTLGLQQNLGDLHRMWGEAAVAEQYYRASLSGLRRTLGPRHADAALPLLGIGLLALDGGDFPSARTHIDEAIELTEASDARPVRLAPLLVARAKAAALAGETREARDFATRASDMLAMLDPPPAELTDELAMVRAAIEKY